MARFGEQETALPEPDITAALNSRQRGVEPAGFSSAMGAADGLLQTGLEYDTQSSLNKARSDFRSLQLQEETESLSDPATPSFDFSTLEGQDAAVVNKTLNQVANLENAIGVRSAERDLRREALLRSHINRRPHLANEFRTINNTYNGTAATRNALSNRSSWEAKLAQEIIASSVKAGYMDPAAYLRDAQAASQLEAAKVAAVQDLPGVKTKLNAYTADFASLLHDFRLQAESGFFNEADARAQLNQLALSANSSMNRALAEYGRLNRGYIPPELQSYADGLVSNMRTFVDDALKDLGTGKVDAIKGMIERMEYEGLMAFAQEAPSLMSIIADVASSENFTMSDAFAEINRLQVQVASDGSFSNIRAGLVAQLSNTAISLEDQEAVSRRISILDGLKSDVLFIHSKKYMNPNLVGASRDAEIGKDIGALLSKATYLRSMRMGGLMRKAKFGELTVPERALQDIGEKYEEAVDTDAVYDPATGSISATQALDILTAPDMAKQMAKDPAAITWMTGKLNNLATDVERAYEAAGRPEYVDWTQNEASGYQRTGGGRTRSSTYIPSEEISYEPPMQMTRRGQRRVTPRDTALVKAIEKYNAYFSALEATGVSAEFLRPSFAQESQGDGGTEEGNG